MAYPRSRSMNAELNEGSTDGKYKKVVRDRGGDVSHVTQFSRDDLKDTYYGIHETAVKERPDGRSVGTPNYTPTVSPEPSV